MIASIVGRMLSGMCAGFALYHALKGNHATAAWCLGVAVVIF